VPAHLDRNGVPRRQTAPSSAPRMSHGRQIFIATGSHSLRSATGSASTLPRSARHFGERMCRFAQDAVGRAPERELPCGSELEDGLS
jgi:hypothetical protein